MKTVVIAGGNGLIGLSLNKVLAEKGFRVLILTRNKNKSISDPSFLHWDPAAEEISNDIQDADIIINLTGAGIADKKWTQERKKEILESRILTTRFLINELKARNIQIDSYINASAVGYYGDHGSHKVTEKSEPYNPDFLSLVCQRWEEEALLAKEVSRNTVIIRIGTVLSNKGGALKEMARTVPCGLAPYFGDGEQFISWVHMHDLCHIVSHIITENLSGIYNCVSPEPLSNKEFMIELKNSIFKRALVHPIPSFILKVMLGEMSSVVLNSTNASSSKIQDSGYEFQYPELSGALNQIYREN